MQFYMKKSKTPLRKNSIKWNTQFIFFFFNLTKFSFLTINTNLTDPNKLHSSCAMHVNNSSKPLTSIKTTRVDIAN